MTLDEEKCRDCDAPAVTTDVPVDQSPWPGNSWPEPAPVCVRHARPARVAEAAA